MVPAAAGAAAETRQALRGAPAEERRGFGGQRDRTRFRLHP